MFLCKHEFLSWNPQHSCKELNMVVHGYNRSIEEAELGELLGFAEKLIDSSRFSERCLTKNMLPI